MYGYFYLCHGCGQKVKALIHKIGKYILVENQVLSFKPHFKF